MRRTDQPIDPEIAAQLDAIDATLAGEPVAPEHAELAELALLLAADRPSLDAGAAAALDQRVARRFASGASPAAASAPPRRRWMAWTLGLASPAVAAAVAIVLLSGGGSGSHTEPLSLERTVSTAASSGSAASASGASAGVAQGSAHRLGPTSSINQTADSTSGNSSTRAQAPTFAPANAPRPPSNGRKIIQSANLELTTDGNRMDQVAQEVYDVVGREKGIVNSSSVTEGDSGYAQFRLSIPSSNLSDAMTALSQLRYATVASRTDNTQDVNGRYISAGRRLADDKALRTSLLKQLAAATTQTAIASLKAQIRDVENAIAGDEAALRSLNNQINYSQVDVLVGTSQSPIVRHHHSSGFTLGKAAHDARRVLTVAAGVALITLAVLAPMLLVAGLIAWVAQLLRRRRREQALDLA
jgi:hypothetical protein